MDYRLRQDFKYNNRDVPVGRWQAHNANTEQTGFGRYGNRRSLDQTRHSEESSITRRSPGLRSKKGKWLMGSMHLQENVFAPKTIDADEPMIQRSTPNNDNVQRIFQKKGLRYSILHHARVTGLPVNMMVGMNNRLTSFQRFRGAGELMSSQTETLDEWRLEDKEVMERAKKEYIQKQRQSKNMGMTFKKPIFHTAMQDTYSQQKQYRANSISINSVLPHAHHREIDSIKRMSTQNDDLMSLSSKFQSIVTSEPPEDTKSKRSFLAKLTFSRRKHKTSNLNDQPSCSNQSTTTANHKFGFIKRLFGSRT